MFELVLIAHFMGDFILQSDNMAKGKSSSMVWLSVHVSVYSLVLLMFASCYFTFTQALAFAAMNGIIHMVVDFFTSRLSSSMWKQQRVHDFFVVIGADQLIHTLTLYWTYLYFEGAIK